LIGSAAVRIASQAAPGWRVVGLTRTELDLGDFRAVERRFRNERPAMVLHFAAISRSPVCEADPGLADRQNVGIPLHLASLASEIPFVFMSTDLVFDGRRGNYAESAPVNPLGVYAESKARAEAGVLRNPRHTVIRTSLNGGRSPTGDRGFNEALRAAWSRGDTVRLFTDEYRSPLHAEYTARAAWELGTGGHSGLFHVAGSERLSRYRIGELLAARWPGLSPRIAPGSLVEYRGAPRPPDTSLDCSKAARVLTFRLPGLTEWLAAHPDSEF
jgi:dTDP-4-dehydrorhamnose reductase